LSRYSEENYLYSGDPATSESQTLPDYYSRGHVRFVKEIAKSLVDKTSASDQVLEASRVIESVHRNSVGLIFYETNPRHVESVLLNEFDCNAGLARRIAAGTWR
jgi:hypothetical protein